MQWFLLTYWTQTRDVPVRIVADSKHHWNTLSCFRLIICAAISGYDFQETISSPKLCRASNNTFITRIPHIRCDIPQCMSNATTSPARTRIVSINHHFHLFEASLYGSMSATFSVPFRPPAFLSASFLLIFVKTLFLVT